MAVAAVMTDEQMGALLASQARCEQSHRQTTAELAGVRATLDTTLSEVERIGRAQDHAESRRQRVSERVGKLETRQSDDDNERTERAGGRKMARAVARVVGPVVVLVVLPLLGWGAAWLAEDYGGQRDALVHVSRDVSSVKGAGRRETIRLDQAREQGHRNAEALRSLEGRLGGLHDGQELILRELQRRRRR